MVSGEVSAVAPVEAAGCAVSTSVDLYFPAALLADIQALVAKSYPQARLLETRKPQTTLERYFLEVTAGANGSSETES